MPLAPKSMQDVDQLSIAAEPAAIREQLQRLLAHPLFANSKRYPALLAYTVEQTLLGNAGELKERSIGVEVFGRAPTYDANSDPVVRITAGEVRKRLTQYYYDPTHRGELVIELPIGSYVPSFRGPERSAIEPELTPAAADPVADSERLPVLPTETRARGLRWWVAGSIVALMVLAASAGWIAGRRYKT